MHVGGRRGEPSRNWNRKYEGRRTTGRLASDGGKADVGPELPKNCEPTLTSARRNIVLRRTSQFDMPCAVRHMICLAPYVTVWAVPPHNTVLDETSALTTGCLLRDGDLSTDSVASHLPPRPRRKIKISPNHRCCQGKLTEVLAFGRLVPGGTEKCSTHVVVVGTRLNPTTVLPPVAA